MSAFEVPPNRVIITKETPKTAQNSVYLALRAPSGCVWGRLKGSGLARATSTPKTEDAGCVPAFEAPPNRVILTKERPKQPEIAQNSVYLALRAPNGCVWGRFKGSGLARA